jgi:oxygen-dependent protoporphyrinogen oxidase
MLRRAIVTRVLVIGGGIAGLSGALALSRAGARVTVCEADSRWGGQLWTDRSDGFVVELGAEGFVANSHAMDALARELDIEQHLVGQLTRRSFGFDGNALVELAPGEAAEFLGFQVPRRDLGQGIRAFSKGMGEVVEHLVDALRSTVDLRGGERVEQLTRAGSVWSARTSRGEIAADEVVVATAARPAAALLAAEFGDAARALGDAALLSSVTVSLAYAAGAFAHALDGTGFVVAERAQDDGFRACTFTTSKFAARAPHGRALLRAFFRPLPGEIERASDDDWIARADRGIARALSPAEPAQRAWVSRWRDALPVTDEAHRARVAALETALLGSKVRLAGAAFHGSGIDAALRSARRACALDT